MHTALETPVGLAGVLWLDGEDWDRHSRALKVNHPLTGAFNQFWNCSARKPTPCKMRCRYMV